jgi:hypothetical protein
LGDWLSARPEAAQARILEMAPTSDPSDPRRRSQRLDKDIPIRVVAESRDGKHVDDEALANQVSSHGLRLSIGINLPTGTEVEIHNPATQLSARFRVVWAQPVADGSREMGLELVGGDAGLWGIDFSAPNP